MEKRPYVHKEDLEDIREREQMAKVLAHAKLVEAVIRAADKTLDPNYKGLTFGEIHRRLGVFSRDLTWNAMQIMELQQAYLVPERYTLRQPKVEYVDKHLWGKPKQITTAPALDPYAYPERAIYGRRDK